MNDIKDKIYKFLDSKATPKGLFWIGVIDCLVWLLLYPSLGIFAIIGIILSSIFLIMIYINNKS